MGTSGRRGTTHSAWRWKRAGRRRGREARRGGQGRGRRERRRAEIEQLKPLRGAVVIGRGKGIEATRKKSIRRGQPTDHQR